jgi:hypothetical protein
MPPPNLNIFATTYSITPGPNRRVTTSQQNEARSESAVAVNPADPSNMICASKKFYDRAKYMSTIGISYTVDGGNVWHEVPLPATPGHPEFTWLVDPDVAFAADGTVTHLWGEPVANPRSYDHRHGAPLGRWQRHWTPWPCFTTTTATTRAGLRSTKPGNHRGTLAVWGSTAATLRRSKEPRPGRDRWKVAGSDINAPTW